MLKYTSVGRIWWHSVKDILLLGTRPGNVHVTGLASSMELLRRQCIQRLCGEMTLDRHSALNIVKPIIRPKGVRRARATACVTYIQLRLICIIDLGIRWQAIQRQFSSRGRR